LTIAVRRLAGRSGRPALGEWWDYLGSFGDDFFGEELDERDGSG
jgi:hypothetical protein